VDSRFICTRCGGFLTMKEYVNNVCLCNRCIVDVQKEFEEKDMVWFGFNNVDLILERKRNRLNLKWSNVYG